MLWQRPTLSHLEAVARKLLSLLALYRRVIREPGRSSVSPPMNCTILALRPIAMHTQDRKARMARCMRPKKQYPLGQPLTIRQIIREPLQAV